MTAQAYSSPEELDRLVEQEYVKRLADAITEAEATAYDTAQIEEPDIDDGREVERAGGQETYRA